MSPSHYSHEELPDEMQRHLNKSRWYLGRPRALGTSAMTERTSRRSIRKCRQRNGGPQKIKGQQPEHIAPFIHSFIPFNSIPRLAYGGPVLSAGPQA